MPAPSKSMRRLAAIALHHPEDVYPENRSILKMDREDLEEYASTKEKGLPKKKKTLRKTARNAKG